MDDFDRALDAFDELVEAGIELSALVSRCAAIFGCRVGVEIADGTSIIGYPGPETAAQSKPATVHDRSLPDGLTVWIAPATDGGYPAALGGETAGSRQERLLRRLGIAVRATTPRRDENRARTIDLRSVVDPTLSDEDRRSAQRRLRLVGATVTAVAVAGPHDGVAAVIGQLRDRSTSLHHLSEQRIHLVLAQDLDTVRGLDIPEGVRCAHSPACPIEQVPTAWGKARSALRFTIPSTHATGPYSPEESVILDSARVGPYTILAEQLTPDQIALVADVQRLDKLYQETGPEMLHTLLAVAATESLRQAARAVHMHHNSVTYRVQRAEKMLGFSCTQPYGRSRLMFILTLHRILDSWRHF